MIIIIGIGITTGKTLPKKVQKTFCWVKLEWMRYTRSGAHALYHMELYKMRIERCKFSVTEDVPSYGDESVRLASELGQKWKYLARLFEVPIRVLLGFNAQLVGYFCAIARLLHKTRALALFKDLSEVGFTRRILEKLMKPESTHAETNCETGGSSAESWASTPRVGVLSARQIKRDLPKMWSSA